MWFPEIRSPTSLRLTMGDAWDRTSMRTASPFVVFSKQAHDSHPSLDHLIVLVFGAVLEVVCVSLPGYIIARLGHFDADKQKFLANLNVMLFTPCLSMQQRFYSPDMWVLILLTYQKFSRNSHLN